MNHNSFSFFKVKCEIMPKFSLPLGPKSIQNENAVVDETSWIIDNVVSDFLLMPGGVLYMCMLGYTFMHGSKVFSMLPSDAPVSYKFISLLMACTGGGILVPIFLNGLPVPLANDAYPIAIITSFCLHYYFPILRDVANMSKIFKVYLIVMYESTRAAVVTKFTMLAAASIPPTTFSFPLFGPIFCGTLAGCGGAFLPLSKGLDPVKDGLMPPMQTALFGSSVLHLFLSTSLSDGCVDAKYKCQVFLALFFISVGIVNAFDLTVKLEDDEGVESKDKKD
jgi:hypothetical protein